MPRLRALLLTALCTGIVSAQGAERTRVRIDELDRHAREIEDLIHRHARGEDVSRSRWLELDSRIAGDDAKTRETLRLTEKETLAMREQLARLQQVRAARREEREREQVGDSLPRREETDRAQRPVSVPPDRVQGTPDPAVSPASTVRGPGRDSQAGSRVQGSSDHRRVAIALMNSGLQARRESRTLGSQGRVAASAAQEDLAQSRLVAARAELEPLITSDADAIVDLFALARCEEALGNFDRADDLYTEVMARDRREQEHAGGDFGTFGRAAATARAVMSWLRESGTWRPRRNVDDLTMPSR